MSFIKKTDPAKRDSIIKETLDLSIAIKQNSLSEKLGNIGLQRELTKLCKPITESQSAITREIGALKESTSSALQALHASISLQLPAITPPTIRVYKQKLLMRRLQQGRNQVSLN